jgi:hypothetical protein
MHKTVTSPKLSTIFAKLRVSSLTELKTHRVVHIKGGSNDGSGTPKLVKKVIPSGGSMAMEKRRGDSGSPCLRPQPCKMGPPPMSLRITRDEEAVSNIVIQLQNLIRKSDVGGGP